MDRQMTLAEMNDEFGAARTNKKEFLEKMDRIIPWAVIIALVQPCYYKGERGNKPYPLELMLRIFILQNLYDLADMKVMNEVLDSRAFSAFCCINSPNEVPDGDTIGRFRNLLTEHDLQKKIFDAVLNLIAERGLILKKKREHEKSSVRCKVEHVFAVVKKLFGYRKTRYRGLRKQTAKNFIMFALANLYLADRKSLSV